MYEEVQISFIYITISGSVFLALDSFWLLTLLHVQPHNIPLM